MSLHEINDSIHTYKCLNHQKVEIVNDGNRGNGLMAKENFDAYLDSTFEHGGKSYCKYLNKNIIGVYTLNFSKMPPIGLYTVMDSITVNHIKESTYGFIDINNPKNVGFCCLINDNFDSASSNAEYDLENKVIKGVLTPHRFVVFATKFIKAGEMSI